MTIISGGRSCGKATMMKAVQEAYERGKADAVGHAYWKWVVTGKGKKIPDANVACSNCGELHGNFDWKYCPNCGSRMDLEVKADE